MTKKEQLYFEYLTVRNEIFTMKGESEKKLNLEEFIATREFRKKADYLTFAKLNTMMADAQEELHKLDKSQRIAIWKESEEGKAYIAERERRKQELLDSSHKLRDEVQQAVSKRIKELLGEQWDVVSFGSYKMEIGMVKGYDEEGRPIGLFGHEFEIYFNKKVFGEDKGSYRWEMNYAAMGDFDLTDDNTRIQHIVGMAKFANDTTVIPELREMLYAMVQELDKSSEEFFRLNDEIKNPKIEL